MRGSQFCGWLRKKIKKPRAQEREAADDPQIIRAHLSSHSKWAVQHHPSTDEIQHRAAERYYWKEQRRLAEELNGLTKRLNAITIGGTVVALAGLLALLCTLSETRRQADTAEQTLRVTQSPYVSMGKADGIVVEYLPPIPGEEKGAMILFFQNTGEAPALSFTANVYSWWPGGTMKTPDKHIRRWREVDERGMVIGYPIYQNAIIGSDSTYAVTVDPKWIPSHDEWQLMNTGQLDDTFMLGGNFEYCDQWGKFHCAQFYVDYQPLPVGRFVAYPHECPLGFPPPLKRKDLSVSRDMRIEILPPCERPGERQVEEEKYRERQRARERRLEEQEAKKNTK